jgi:hypothetical protein
VLSGDDLLSQHPALTIYASVAPVVLAVFWLATGLGVVAPWMRAASAPLIIVTFPAIFFSFLGIGFLLLIPGAVWIRLLVLERRQALNSG